MADSVGGGFPTTGIQKGHLFFELNNDALYRYIGGDPRLQSSWILVDGLFDSQPDTSLWGVNQTGAMWTLTNGNTYTWNGSSIDTIQVVSSVRTDQLILVDDFCNGSGASGLTGLLGWFTIGGSSSLSVPVNVNNPGVYSRNANVAGVYAILVPSTVATIVIPDNFDMIWIVNPVVVDSDTIVRIGMLDTINTAPANGVYFEKLAADVNWFAVNALVGSITRVDTEIPISLGNFVKLQITKVDKGNVKYKVNGVQVAETASHIIAIGVPILFNMQILSVTGALKTIQIDYFGYQQNGINR